MLCCVVGVIDVKAMLSFIIIFYGWSGVCEYVEKGGGGERLNI